MAGIASCGGVTGRACSMPLSDDMTSFIASRSGEGVMASGLDDGAGEGLREMCWASIAELTEGCLEAVRDLTAIL